MNGSFKLRILKRHLSNLSIRAKRRRLVSNISTSLENIFLPFLHLDSIKSTKNIDNIAYDMVRFIFFFQYLYSSTSHILPLFSKSKFHIIMEVRKISWRHEKGSLNRHSILHRISFYLLYFYPFI